MAIGGASCPRLQTLTAYNKQVRQLPEDIQQRECARVEIGRQHARNFDAGYSTSGGAAQRVLTELRKLAVVAAPQAATTATPGRSKLDDLRARRAARRTDAQNRERPPWVTNVASSVPGHRCPSRPDRRADRLQALGDDPGVTAPSNRPDPPTPRPLSNWTIVAGALVVLGVASVIGFVPLRRYGGQGAQVQLDAIRTAGTLAIGTDGAVALLLTGVNFLGTFTDTGRCCGSARV